MTNKTIGELTDAMHHARAFMTKLAHAETIPDPESLRREALWILAKFPTSDVLDQMAVLFRLGQ